MNKYYYCVINTGLTLKKQKCCWVLVTIKKYIEDTATTKSMFYEDLLIVNYIYQHEC